MIGESMILASKVLQVLIALLWIVVKVVTLYVLVRGLNRKQLYFFFLICSIFLWLIIQYPFDLPSKLMVGFIWCPYGLILWLFSRRRGIRRGQPCYTLLVFLYTQTELSLLSIISCFNEMFDQKKNDSSISPLLNISIQFILCYGFSTLMQAV